MVRGPKSIIEFVWGDNPMTLPQFCPDFFTPVMHFQWDGSNTTEMRPDDV